jgi:hypothetical protein
MILDEGVDEVDDLVREADEEPGAVEVVPARDAALVPEGDVGKQGEDRPVVVDSPLHRLVLVARDQVVQALPADRVVLNVLPIQGSSIHLS